MPPKKYVLVVDRFADMRQGRPGLDGLDCEVDCVAGLAGALSVAARLEKLSLIVVNSDSHRYGRQRFTSSLRSVQPRLPLLWIDSFEPDASGPAPPRAATRHHDADGLKKRAAQLLQEEFYGSSLADDITNVAHRVFGEFGLEAECSGPYIKSSLSALSDLNALIAFEGERLSGHVLLGSTLTSARALHENALPGEAEPSADDLEDLLGEVTNRLVGGIKRVFEARSRSFKLKATAFFRGPTGRYRNKASSPSLALEFTDRGGALSLEFCAERIASGELVMSSEAAFVEPGQIHFL
jgi:CheY-specific phosphatase CheX